MTKLEVTELDFDTLRNSLRDYLRSQEELKDYDYEGAAASILLNILSQNTHYVAFLANMLHNEAYLDSATLRPSVVSRAKELGYTPRSITASKAEVNVSINPTYSPLGIVIERGTKFETTVDGTSYPFVTLDTYNMAQDSDGTFSADVRLHQGRLVTNRFTVDQSDPDQKFVIPNDNIDTSTLRVSVQQSSSNTKVTFFEHAANLTHVGEHDDVYWLHETSNGKYEVVFGDGILGTKLSDGNIVICEYVATAGPDVNGANTFRLVSPIQGYNVATVSTNNRAEGGAERESIDSIRFHAPRSRETGGRAVTAEDYKVILMEAIQTEYPNIESLNVWGGEDNDPPAYGKTFISVKPREGTIVSQAAKQGILNQVLQPRNVMSIIPEFVDPSYLYVDVSSEILYDPKLTQKTSEQIRQLVINTIESYNSDNLRKFESKVRYSKLITLIDSAERSIRSNLTSLTLKYKLHPDLNRNRRYDIRLSNAIRSGSVKTSKFKNTAIGGNSWLFIRDDEQGNLSIYKYVDLVEHLVESDIGTVDYAKGLIQIKSLAPNELDGTFLSVTATPLKNNINPSNNQILMFDKIDTSIRADV